MSLIITTDVQCDVCGEWSHGTTHPSKVRGKVARYEAKRRDGFVRQRSEDGSTYLDLCNVCAQPDDSAIDQPLQDTEKTP